MRAAGIVILIAILASIIASGISYAKQGQTKPEIRQFDTQKAVSAVPAVPPCLRHLSPGDRPQFVLRSADGTVIIVGSEDARKRC